MTDHANELRRYSRKIGHPAGDVPSVMRAAAEEIERLAARLKAAEKDVTTAATTRPGRIRCTSRAAGTRRRRKKHRRN